MTHDQIVVLLTVFGLIGLVVGAMLGYYKGYGDAIESSNADDAIMFQSLELMIQSIVKDTQTLQAQMIPHLENSQRYQLVRYYLENDHGGLAVNVFYGPGGITTALELDALLDTELDERGASLTLEGANSLNTQLNNKEGE